jgi:hypothetical protein
MADHFTKYCIKIGWNFFFNRILKFTPFLSVLCQNSNSYIIMLYIFKSDFLRNLLKFIKIKCSINSSKYKLIKIRWQINFLEQFKSKATIMVSSWSRHFSPLQNYCVWSHPTCQKCSSREHKEVLLPFITIRNPRWLCWATSYAVRRFSRNVILGLWRSVVTFGMFHNPW